MLNKGEQMLIAIADNELVVKLRIKVLCFGFCHGIWTDAQSSLPVVMLADFYVRLSKGYDIRYFYPEVDRLHLRFNSKSMSFKASNPGHRWGLTALSGVQLICTKNASNPDPTGSSYKL